MCADQQQVSTSKSLVVAARPTPSAAPGVSFALRNTSSHEGFRARSSTAEMGQRARLARPAGHYWAKCPIPLLFRRRDACSALRTGVPTGGYLVPYAVPSNNLAQRARGSSPAEPLYTKW